MAATFCPPKSALSSREVSGWGDLPTAPAVDISLTDGRVVIQTKEPVVVAQRIRTWALDRGVELEHLAVNQPTVEDIYLELTGSQADKSATEEVPA